MRWPTIPITIVCLLASACAPTCDASTSTTAEQDVRPMLDQGSWTPGYVDNSAKWCANENGYWKPCVADNSGEGSGQHSFSSSSAPSSLAQ